MVHVRYGSLGLALLILAACGGGGGGGLPGPGGLESFAPFTVPADGGGPSVVTWTYRVNDGQPFEVDESGATLRLTFSDPMTVTYDPATGLRSTNAPFGFFLTIPDVPGSTQGTGRITNEETIEVVEGITRITGSAGELRMTGAYLIITQLTLAATANIAFDQPLDWFPDREDLDQLEIGFVHQPEADVAGTVSGEVSLDFILLPFPTTPYTQPFTAPQRWEIVDRLPSMSVGGRVFTNVVVVDLTTVVPDLRNPTEPVSAEGAVRMWFAKGVGMIKATGAYQIWETPLDLEIIDSSLLD